MHKSLGYLDQTPSQTAGPYVHIGLAPGHAGLEGPWLEFATTMVREETSGERITITGAVFDGAGAPLRDALIEIWQADANGVYTGQGDPRGAGDPFFTGFGRQAADAQTGEFRFETIRPGPVPAPGGGLMAPHVSFWIVARGINLGLHTRMYFPEDDHDNDPLLARIEHRDRIRTLVARKRDDVTYQFNIYLQGFEETVFFDI